MKQDNPVAEAGLADTTTTEDAEPAPQRRGGEWRERANCLRTDPEIFFSDMGLALDKAKKICASCQVIESCLGHALNNGEHFGVWGGLSHKERQALRPGAPSEGETARHRRERAVMELRKHGRNAASIGRTTGLNERTVHRIINRAAEAQKGA